MKIRAASLSLVLTMCLVVRPSPADVINISSLYTATVASGDTVEINFGIGTYASQAIEAGYSPYPTHLDLEIVTMLPTSNIANFSVAADLDSLDRAISVPIGPNPLPLAVGGFSANNGPTVPIGIFFGSVDFSSAVSQELFNPADFIQQNTEAATLVVTNLGDAFTIGVAGYYANTFPIGGCCAEAPGISGNEPLETGGNTGTVFLVTAAPEPPSLPVVLGMMVLVAIVSIRRGKLSLN